MGFKNITVELGKPENLIGALKHWACGHTTVIYETGHFYETCIYETALTNWRLQIGLYIKRHLESDHIPCRSIALHIHTEDMVFCL